SLVGSAGGPVARFEIGAKVRVVEGGATSTRSLLDVDFGMSYGIADSLGAFRNIFSHPDFLDHTSLLGDDRLLGKLLRFNHVFLPSGQISRGRSAVDWAALHTDTFLAQFHGFFNRLFNDSRINANAAPEDLPFPYLHFFFHDRDGAAFFPCTGWYAFGVHINRRVAIEKVLHDGNVVLIRFDRQETVALFQGRFIFGAIGIIL